MERICDMNSHFLEISVLVQLVSIIALVNTLLSFDLCVKKV